ncbi:MAG: YeeE/YedE thiosulfate transporter family protein [Thermoanaerobaculia bacterium]
MKPSRPYSDPYLAGVGLGLVLLVAIVATGHGLGASGAFATTAAGIVAALDAPAAAASPLWSRYLGGGGPWNDWLLVELLGVVLGGFLSAAFAGRLRREIERGPHVAGSTRLLAAAGGGIVMGAGAVLARGCTSGQALTGGALLSVGSWAFMIGAFGSAFVVAPFLKRQWK